MPPKTHFPQTFRATGQGWANRLPNTPATQHTGNGLLHNRGLADANPNARIYLFVTDILTSWEVAGDYGQAAYSRTFYPKNYRQNNFTIRGIVPNQYEYDRLVEFVTIHHREALGPGDESRPLQFELKPRIEIIKAGGKLIRKELVPGFSFAAYALSIRAGHERYMFAPTWELELKKAVSSGDEYPIFERYTSKTLEQQIIGGNVYKQKLQKPPPYRPPTVVTKQDSQDFWQQFGLDPLQDSLGGRSGTPLGNF